MQCARIRFLGAKSEATQTATAVRERLESTLQARNFGVQHFVLLHELRLLRPELGVLRLGLAERLHACEKKSKFWLFRSWRTRARRGGAGRDSGRYGGVLKRMNNARANFRSSNRARQRSGPNRVLAPQAGDGGGSGWGAVSASDTSFGAINGVQSIPITARKWTWLTWRVCVCACGRKTSPKKANDGRVVQRMRRLGST